MANNIFQKFKKLPIYFVAFFLAFVVFMGIAVVYAWTEPTSAPPAGNVSAPVNVGATSQYKDGALGVGGVFHGYGTGLFDGNVGIGTTPSQKLDVNGIIAVEGQAALDQNGTNILVGDLAGGDGARGLILRSGDRDRAMISGAETIFYDSNGNQVLILDQGN